MALRDLYSHTAFNESEILNADVQEKIGVKRIIIHLIELPLLLCGCVFCTVFFRVVRRTRCFHQNLRFLLGNFALSFLIVIFSRFAIIVPLIISFAANADVSEVGWCRGAKALHDCGLYVGSLNIVILVGERTFATVYVRRYETKKTTLLGILLVTFQWLFSLFFVWFNQVNSKVNTISFYLTYCQREYYASSAMRIFFLALLACDFVSIIVFLLLLHVNKKRYRHTSSGFEKHYALSTRYQIAENVKTTRLLYPLVLAYLTGSVISIIILYQAGKTLKSENIGSPFQIYLAATNWGQTFDILFAILAIIFPHLAIYGHHSLLREFRKVLTLDRGNRPRRPKNLNGEPLILTMTQERTLHFERLEQMWQHSPRRP